MNHVFWRTAGTPRRDGPGAVVSVEAMDEDLKLYGAGDVRVTERGLLATTLPRHEGPPDLPDSLRGAVGFVLGGLESLREVVAKEARATGLIPAADPARDITSEPRILTLREGDAGGEGCVVVVDDPGAVAVVASGCYDGPPGPANLDHVRYPAGLPGRRYLQAATRTTTRYILSALAPTVFLSWADAQAAIFRARDQGLFRAVPRR